MKKDNTTNEHEERKKFPEEPNQRTKSDTYLPNFLMPPNFLFNSPLDDKIVIDENEQATNKANILRTFKLFEIPVKKISIAVGPTVTLYEIAVDETVRLSKIRQIQNEILDEFSVKGTRLIVPLPGKGTIGFEVPNKSRTYVSLESIVESAEFNNPQYGLPIALGRNASNEVRVADLSKLPHLLVVGNMTQSVAALNTIIASVLYKKRPSELKFVLVDTYGVEFGMYDNLEKHYLAKMPNVGNAVLSQPRQASATMHSLCKEMDNRFNLLMETRSRSVEEYNFGVKSGKFKPENGHRYLPYIVVVVNDFAHMIMAEEQFFETPVIRLAQKGRAVGIHMIVATQRSSENVITGIIKVNFPGRIVFDMPSERESLISLGQPGAERLIGHGDMLFGKGDEIERIQCAYIDTVDTNSICDFISKQNGFEQPYLLPECEPEPSI